MVLDILRNSKVVPNYENKRYFTKKKGLNSDNNISKKIKKMNVFSFRNLEQVLTFVKYV